MSQPPVTNCNPLWEPLGVRRTPWGKRYFIKVNDYIYRLRAEDMLGLGWLMIVFPEPNYWRLQFPKPRSPYKIATRDAMAWFCRKCEAVGEYHGDHGPVGAAREP